MAEDVTHSELVLSSLADQLGKLIWLSYEIECQLIKNTESLDIARIINQNSSILVKKQADLEAARQAILAYSISIEPRINDLQKLVAYSGKDIKITSMNIGLAASSVMN